MKQGAKIVHICSVVNYPLEKKFIGTSSILARSKSRVLPTDAIYCICQVVNGTAVIFHSRSILWIEFTVSSSHWNVPMTSARAWSRSELLYQPPPMSIELPETITIHDEPLKTTESLTYLGRRLQTWKWKGGSNPPGRPMVRYKRDPGAVMTSAQKPKWRFTQLQSSLACSIPSRAPLFTAGTLWLWQVSSFATYAVRHPQHQVARPYPRRWGTAPCSHSQCWSPNNRVTASPLGRTCTSDGQ